MNSNNKKILTTSLIAAITLVTAFTLIAPQAPPAHAGFPTPSEIGNKVKDLLKPLFDIIEDLLDDVVNNAEHGLAAIDDQVEDIIDNLDYGLKAIDDQVEDAIDNLDYGLKAIDDEVEDVIDNIDYGLKAIDDEVEFMGDKTLQQLSKQEVDINVKKSNNLTYLQTTESGKPVDVVFLSVELILGTEMVPLVPAEVVAKISGTTGLYLLDVGKTRNVDSIIVEVQHIEDKVIHATLSPAGTDVDHFGATLITPQGSNSK